MCERMYNSFRAAGRRGIDSIGEAGQFWIVEPALLDSNETEFGTTPYIVDKTTGETRCFNPVNDNDWEVFDEAVPLDVPDQFKPKY